MFPEAHTHYLYSQCTLRVHSYDIQECIYAYTYLDYNFALHSLCSGNAPTLYIQRISSDNKSASPLNKLKSHHIYICPLYKSLSFHNPHYLNILSPRTSFLCCHKYNHLCNLVYRISVTLSYNSLYPCLDAQHNNSCILSRNNREYCLLHILHSSIHIHAHTTLLCTLHCYIARFVNSRHFPSYTL